MSTRTFDDRFDFVPNTVEIEMKKQIKFVLLAALGAAGLVAGCATERASDAKITANVQSQFDQHPEIGAEVNVQTLDRVVYLTGFVSAGEMRTTAASIAQATPGVTRVVDTIAVTK